MHDMALTFTHPSPRHDSSHYAPVTTHSPRQAIAPCPHPGYQHDSSQVQARPPVFQLGSNYSVVPGGQFVQSSSTHGGIFGVAHDPLPPPMYSNYQGTYMPNTHHRSQYDPQNNLHATTSHIPTTATTPPPLMISTIATQPGEVSDIVAPVTRESCRKGRANCWITFCSWALNEMKPWGKDQPKLTYQRNKKYVGALWRGLPKDERLWWRRQTELLHVKVQEQGVPPTGGSAAAAKLRKFDGSVYVPPATEGPSRKKPKTTHTASRATAAQHEPTMASTSSGGPRRSVARPRPKPDREHLRKIQLAVQQHTVVFSAVPTGEHSSLGASVPSAVGSFVQDPSASLSLVWACSPLPSHRSGTDGLSLPDASASPMGEPFVQVASASVSPSGASSPLDSHASATRECSDASTESCPSDTQHTVSSVDDIPWRAHHTWPFGPQGHTSPPLVRASSPPPSRRSGTDGRSLLDASAPPMVEPFVQVASASVSPSGASSPSDPHTSTTREYSDASAAPATEAYPSNAQHTVSSVDDIPWRAHHTWPFGPQDHAILRPAQVPSSGPEETHTLWDTHPSCVEDYNFDFTDPFGSADYGALVPGPSTAEILSTLTTRLDPSVLSNHSTLELALGH